MAISITITYAIELISCTKVGSIKKCSFDVQCLIEFLIKAKVKMCGLVVCIHNSAKSSGDYLHILFSQECIIFLQVYIMFSKVCIMFLLPIFQLWREFIDECWANTWWSHCSDLRGKAETDGSMVECERGSDLFHQTMDTSKWHTHKECMVSYYWAYFILWKRIGQDNSHLNHLFVLCQLEWDTVIWVAFEQLLLWV